MQNHIVLYCWRYYRDYRRNTSVKLNAVIIPIQNWLYFKLIWEQTFFFTFHSLVFRVPSLCSEASPFAYFLTPTIFCLATVILSYFLLWKRFEKNLKHETNQNCNLCLLFFLKQKCNLHVMLKIKVSRLYFYARFNAICIWKETKSVKAITQQ